MSSDDDTILSAYMDGQLDADQQQRVESALVASSRLAGNLRALTAVRDLVAGLPRDSGTDVSPEVMRRIRGLSRSRSRLSSYRAWVIRARRVAVVAGTVSAAGILLMITVMFAQRPGAGGITAVSRQVSDNVIADSEPGSQTTSADEKGVSVALNSSSSSSRGTNTRSETSDSHSLASGRHESQGAALEASSTNGDLELSRRMLENPAERRLFLINNGADGQAQQRVASVVERTSRLGFFKITVSQGIVIDPRHPDEATVFALLVSPGELGHLRDQLKEVAPDALEEKHADPGIVTQLADIGQVQQFAPVPAADMATPGEALALRIRVGAVENGAPAPLAAAEKGSARPTREQYHSAPVPPPATVRSSSASEPESSTEGAAVEIGARVAEAPGRARARASEPQSEAKVAPAESGRAARASETAKSDEMVLVFVWVCKTRPS